MTDLPNSKISDEMVDAGALVLRESVKRHGAFIGTETAERWVRDILAAALVASGWRPEADVLRPVTWQVQGKLPAAFHQHRCGAVEWWPMEGADSGGCDACESGSDDPRDWRMLYAADWPATALEPPLPLPVAAGLVCRHGWVVTDRVVDCPPNCDGLPPANPITKESSRG